MLGIENAWLASRDSLAEGFKKPRQLFVTQSQTLAANVRDYYRKLRVPYSSQSEYDPSCEDTRTETVSGLLTDNDEECVSLDGLPDRWSDLQDEHFPLFLSFDHVSCFSEPIDACINPSRAALSSSRRGRA